MKSPQKGIPWSIHNDAGLALQSARDSFCTIHAELANAYGRKISDRAWKVYRDLDELRSELDRLACEENRSRAAEAITLYYRRRRADYDVPEFAVSFRTRPAPRRGWKHRRFTLEALARELRAIHATMFALTNLLARAYPGKLAALAFKVEDEINTLQGVLSDTVRAENPNLNLPVRPGLYFRMASSHEPPALAAALLRFAQGLNQHHPGAPEASV